MSEAYDNLCDVVQDRISFTGDPVLNLRTNVPFTAEIETNLDPLTLPAELMDDPREKIRLHVTTNPNLVKNDYVRIFFNGAPTKFQIVHGYYSAASVTSKFIAAEIIAKDQT